MTQSNLTKQVPQELLDMLYSHVSNGILSTEFLHGYCCCLCFQFPQSDFSAFYDYHSLLINNFPTKLKNFLNSGKSAPLSPAPVQGEGT